MGDACKRGLSPLFLTEENVRQKVAILLGGLGLGAGSQDRGVCRRKKGDCPL